MNMFYPALIRKKFHMQHMLEYMISLMDDANDFSWISAKASHAVLLCRIEQGEVKSYSDVLAIDCITRTNAQKHVTVSPATSVQNPPFARKFGKTTKSMPCTYFNQGTCVQKKSHETRGYFISTSVLLTLPYQEKPFLILKLSVKISSKARQKTNKRVLTHKDRFFVNTNTNAIDVNNQFSATRDTWLTWFVVNRSLNTSVNHR